MKLVTPKYLTVGVAETAVKTALETAFNSGLASMLKRNHCHIVVLVPAMKDAREENYPEWPNYPTRAYPLYQESFGDRKEWEHPYNEVAMCKALQLWTDRNDDRTYPIPHLLFPGDTPFWGGVKRRGIVVCCSGVQPWFDKMISGLVADIMVALAHDAYENDTERIGADFLA
jgi:hypothetical protein